MGSVPEPARIRLIQASLPQRSVSYEVLHPGTPGIVEVVSLQQPQFGPALDPATLGPCLWFGFVPGPLCGFRPYHLWRTGCLTSHAAPVGLVSPLESWQNHCKAAEVAAIQVAAPVGCKALQTGSRSAGEVCTGHPVLPSFPGQP